MKPCNNCGQQIDFKQLPNKKWKPINTNGTDHRCNAAGTNGNETNGSSLHVVHESDTELVLRWKGIEAILRTSEVKQ